MVYLKNQDGYEYHFQNVDEVDWDINTNAYSLPVTEMDNAMVFNLGGRSKIIRISWIIKDEDIDVSNGTYSSAVKTKAEQIVYLDEEFATAEIDLGVEVVIDEVGLSYKGVTKRFNARWRAGEEVIIANLEVLVGDVMLSSV